ncbi:MAG: T9SS type A sorting domain-containing protein [Candidatus Cloacimonadaceae bacterium]|nr:T9SS type A sorting domain-containing protein [Candidatus Cloacimonadaceae bacterium]
MKTNTFALTTGRIRFFALLLMALLPLIVFAQTLFTFQVDDLEAYDRSGNWIYDADAPGFPTHDMNWFTFSPVSPHYYAERYIHNGLTTTMTCTFEGVPLASSPGQISIHFNEFDLVSFQRINTVNPLMPWNTPGQSGDKRVYANASGYIAYLGTPVLYMNNATFVITTPYPTQAQIRALSPIFSAWVGDIGTGLFQSGFGFGELDLVTSDPTWAALFAGSNYQIDLEMVGVVSIPTPTTGLFDFALNVAPSATLRESNNDYVNLGALPWTTTFPQVKAGVEVNAGVPGGENNDMQHVYLTMIGEMPTPPLPLGMGFSTNKFWRLGTTLSSFLLNLTFNVEMADFAKAPADWRIIYRPNDAAPWTLWSDFTLIDANHIRANNVSQVGDFAIASPFDETLPVELSYFAAVVTADNYAQVKWITSSESDMAGYKVFAAESNDLNSALCLTPVLIPANNTSTTSSYSFTATEITEPGTYYFWLEAIALGGYSDFHGPVWITLTDNPGSPELPARNLMGNAYPNPFHGIGNARIDVEIKAGEQGTVTIYNVSGQIVRSFGVEPGIHTIQWNGMDSKGKACASGVYLYKLSTPSYNQTRKLVLVK